MPAKKPAPSPAATPSNSFEAGPNDHIPSYVEPEYDPVDDGDNQEDFAPPVVRNVFLNPGAEITGAVKRTASALVRYHQQGGTQGNGWNHSQEFTFGIEGVLDYATALKNLQLLSNDCTNAIAQAMGVETQESDTGWYQIVTPSPSSPPQRPAGAPQGQGGGYQQSGPPQRSGPPQGGGYNGPPRNGGGGGGGGGSGFVPNYPPDQAKKLWDLYAEWPDGFEYSEYEGKPRIKPSVDAFNHLGMAVPQQIKFCSRPRF